MEPLHKTTILLPETMRERLAALARQRGTSMGELIRRAVEVEYGKPDPEDRLEAVRLLAALALPVGSPAEMKAESTEPPGDVP